MPREKYRRREGPPTVSSQVHAMGTRRCQRHTAKTVSTVLVIAPARSNYRSWGCVAANLTIQVSVNIPAAHVINTSTVSTGAQASVNTI